MNPGSLGAQAGLRLGDKVLEVCGTAVSGLDEFFAALRSARKESTVELTVERQDAELLKEMLNNADVQREDVGVRAVDIAVGVPVASA
eukprot:223225-Prymnesium_polylepis.1